MSPDVCASVPPGCPAGDGMTAFIWFGVLAVYVAGLFPAAVQIVRYRASGLEPRCPKRQTLRYCLDYHPTDCRQRHGTPRPADLKWTPLGFAWPFLVLATLILWRAAKPSHVVVDLQRQIEDLESQLGMNR